MLTPAARSFIMESDKEIIAAIKTLPKAKMYWTFGFLGLHLFYVGRKARGVLFLLTVCNFCLFS